MAETLSLAVNCMAVVDLAAKLASTLYTYGREVSGARDEIDRLRAQVVRLGEVTQSVHDLLKRHGKASSHLRTFQLIQDGVFQTETNLVQLSQDLDISEKKRSMRRFGFRALKWPLSQGEVMRTLSSLERCFQTLSQSLQVDQTSVLLDVDRRQLFDSLPYAEDAAFDSRVEEGNPTCHPQTRSGILSDIHQWAEDPQAKNVFWLNGMAGTGKSTISRTMASALSKKGSLAASFFFKRGEGNRGNCARFFSTVAVQLALREPEYAAGLRSSLSEDPSLTSKSLREQWDKLVMEPLSRVPLQQRRVKTLVIVVDALDECDNDNDIRLLIYLMSNAAWAPEPWRLKTFITSRPELPIRLGFGAVEGTFQDLILHDVSADVVESEIRVYLEDELANIRDDFNLSVAPHRCLDDSWPSHTSVKTISEMAMPLFIFAATVCRFVSDRKAGSPEKQLQFFLDYESSERVSSKLGAIYLPILEQTVSELSGAERAEVLAEFRLIVGTIVLLFEALPVGSLANIINRSVARIEERLDLLHSVLNVPPSPEMPVRLLHLSFRDFVTDRANGDGNNPFSVDQERGHEAIARGCIEVMEHHLHKDMKKILSKELKYACRWWIPHLIEAKVRFRDNDWVHTFIDKHFLHWLEATCLPDINADVLGLWKSLGPILNKEHEAPLFHAFYADALRVIATNVQLIYTHPMSVYSSMLIFCPTNSIVRQRYADEMPTWITVGHRTRADWDPLEMSFHYDHINGSVRSVAISPDNNFMALVCLTGFVQSRNIASGRLCFSSSIPGINKVVFSYNSKLVIFAGDGRLQIYVSATGQKIQYFDIHGLWAVSTDSPHLALVTASGDIDILELGSGPAGTCYNYMYRINAAPLHKAWLNLCSSELVIATKYLDHQVEIWRAPLPAPTTALDAIVESYDGCPLCSKTQTITTPETVYRNKYAGVVLSPDSSQLVLILPGSTLASRIEIYRVSTGEQTQLFESDYSLQESIIFSPRSQVIARDSGMGVVNIRDTTSGETLVQLDRRGAMALAFSEDLTLVVMGFSNSVQIWNFAAMKSQMVPPSIQSIGGHSNNHKQELSRASNTITWIELAPDITVVAVGTASGEVQIWDPKTHTRTMTIKGHTSPVLLAIFSDDMERLITISKSELRVWSLVDGTLRCESENKKRLIEMLCKKYREERGKRRLNFIKGIPPFSSSILDALPEHRRLPLSDYGPYDGYRLVVGEVEFHQETGHLATQKPGKNPGRTALWRYMESTWSEIKEFSQHYGDERQERKMKISRDGRYLIMLSAMVSIEVWSLTTYEILGEFSHPVTRLMSSVQLGLFKSTGMSFGCQCSVFLGIYSNWVSNDEDRYNLNIGIRICSCHGKAIPSSQIETRDLTRVYFFYYSPPKSRIRLLSSYHLQDDTVEFMGRGAMALPTAQQAKMVRGRRCYDQLFNFLAIATESEEVLFLSINDETQHCVEYRTDETILNTD